MSKEEQINDINVKIKELKEQLEELKDYDMNESDYDDFLDECYPSVNIGSMVFNASQILKNCDEIAYNMGKSEEESRYIDDHTEELEQEITDLENEIVLINQNE